MRHKTRRKWLRGLAAALPALAVVAVLCASVSGSLAWLSTSTAPKTNVFEPQTAAIEIVESFENNVKSSIAVKNTGDVEVYVRVQLVSTTAGSGGALAVDANTNLNAVALASGWVKHTDGYYYCTSTVATGSTSSNMLAAPIVLAPDQTVTVLAQCIQAQPASAVTAAWDVDPAGLAVEGGGE